MSSPLFRQLSPESLHQIDQTGRRILERIGNAISSAASAGAVDLEALSVYERRWQEEIGDELKFGHAARLLFSALTNEEIDRLFAAIDVPETLGMIAQNGDIDYPSRLIDSVLTQKKIRTRLLSAIGGWSRAQDLIRIAFASEGETPI